MSEVTPIVPSLLPAAPEAGRVALPELALPPGTVIDEFEIQGQLGMGGFGVVYRAFDRALERTVALKEYLPQQSASRAHGGQVLPRTEGERERFETGLKAFVREARMLASFDHPSLVKVYRYAEHHGTAYMVMPCYEGQTLIKARAALGGPPDQAGLWRVLKPLMDAVEQLHARDVLHRDISPDNVILQADGVPVLLDFGAARQMVAASTPLTAIFKPSFGAIEQYSNDERSPLGPWTDVYGLASLAHYWLTGQVPQAAVTRILQDDAASFEHLGRMLRKELGLAFDDAFMRALDWGFSVHPQDRPRSLADWRAALLGEASQLVQLPAAVIDQPGSAPAPARAVDAGANDWAETQMLDVTTAWPVTQEAPAAPAAEVAAQAAASPKERRLMVAGVAAAGVMLVALAMVVKTVGRPAAEAPAVAAPPAASGGVSAPATLAVAPARAASPAVAVLPATTQTPAASLAQGSMQGPTQGSTPAPIAGRESARVPATERRVPQAQAQAKPSRSEPPVPAAQARPEAPAAPSRSKDVEAAKPVVQGPSPYAQCGSQGSILAAVTVLHCRRKSCESPDPRDAKVCKEFRDMEARQRSQEF